MSINLSNEEVVLKDDVLKKLQNIGENQMSGDSASDDYLALARGYMPEFLQQMHCRDHWTTEAYREALYSSSPGIQSGIRLLMNDLCSSLMLNPEYFVFGLFCRVEHEATDALGELFDCWNLNRYLSSKLHVPASAIQAHYVPLFDNVKDSPLPALLLAVSAVSEFDGKLKKRIFTKKCKAEIRMETNALFMVAVKTATVDIAELLDTYQNIQLSGSVLAEYTLMEGKSTVEGRLNIFPESVAAPFDAIEQWPFRDAGSLALKILEEVNSTDTRETAEYALHMYVATVSDEEARLLETIPGGSPRSISLHVSCGLLVDAEKLSFEESSPVFMGTDTNTAKSCMHSVLDVLAKSDFRISHVKVTSLLSEVPEQIMSFVQ